MAVPTSVVRHLRTQVDGIDTFYRECGPADAPVVLLPHGYPCSSYEFRHLMPLLGDRWRLVAPDFPGSGYSETPADFDYSFGGFAVWLERFAAHLGLDRFALYLHDFGTWIGLRLAMQAPERIAALIIQNGDIYRDALGPKYAGLLQTLDKPAPEALRTLREGIDIAEFEREFRNGSEGAVGERLPPDLWVLHDALMTDERRDIAARVILDWKANADWFPRYQSWLREHRPPTMIVWGPCDGYMPAASARAYLRDLPDAELHLLDDGGHWLLETHLPDVAPLARAFLARNHPRPDGA